MPTLCLPQIALCHDSAPSSLLERYCSSKEDAPGGCVVFLVDPLVDRALSLVKQGMLTKDKEDCCKANKEKMKNDFYYLG